MFFSGFSDINIEILLIKLFLDVLFFIEKMLSVFEFHSVGDGVEARLGMPDEVQHEDIIIAGLRVYLR